MRIGNLFIILLIVIIASICTINQSVMAAETSSNISSMRVGNFIFISSVPESVSSIPAYRGIIKDDEQIDFHQMIILKPRQNVLSDRDARNATIKAMEKYGGVPPDAVFTGTNAEYLETINLSTMQVVQKVPVLISVSFIRKIDGKSIVGVPDIIHLDFGETDEPLSIIKRWRSVGYAGYNVSIISVEEALEKLEQQDIMIKPICEDCFTNATIHKMTLGFYEGGPDYREIIFQPVWIFEGNSASGKKFYNYVYAKKFANFTSTTTTGIVPLTVAFNDTSTDNPLRWRWDFGDGTNSTEQNPVHRYVSTGKYTVSLWVWDGIGSDTKTKAGYITVRLPAPPVANFTATPTSGIKPLSVTFNDTSTNAPASWLWTFGDGTNSTIQHPVHIYTSAGNYTVSLNVTNGDGASAAVKEKYISVFNPPPTTIPTTTATTTVTTKPTTTKPTPTKTHAPLSPMVAVTGIALVGLLCVIGKKKAP